MGKMSSLHAESADERACALANDVDYLEKCIEELSEALRPFVAYGEDLLTAFPGLKDCTPFSSYQAHGQQWELTIRDLRAAAKALAMFGDGRRPAPVPPADPWPTCEF